MIRYPTDEQFSEHPCEHWRMSHDEDERADDEWCVMFDKSIFDPTLDCALDCPEYAPWDRTVEGLLQDQERDGVMSENIQEVVFSENADENAEARWVTLFVHGHEVAAEEGLISPLKVVFGDGVTEVYFTDRLVIKYEDSTEVMRSIAQEGLRLLDKPDSEDNERLRRRMLEDDTVMVVQDPYAIIFLTPDDWGDSGGVCDVF